MLQADYPWNIPQTPWIKLFCLILSCLDLESCKQTSKMHDSSCSQFISVEDAAKTLRPNMCTVFYFYCHFVSTKDLAGTLQQKQPCIFVAKLSPGKKCRSTASNDLAFFSKTKIGSNSPKLKLCFHQFLIFRFAIFHV